MDRNGSEVGTAGYHVFIDGKLEGSDTSLTEGSAAGSTQNLLLGEFSTSYEFDGAVDQARIYNYARTRAQIAWDYNRGGPVGWWKMDECQGGTANDASGNSNNGAITIGSLGSQASLGTCAASAATAWYNGRTGKFNSSLNFDGTDDYISSPITTSNGLDIKGPITYSLWFKRASTSDAFLALISKLDTCTSAETDGFIIRFGTGNTLRFEGYKTGGVFSAIYTSSSLIADTANWHNAVAVWDGTTNANGAKLYVDGRLAAQATSTASDFIYLNGFTQEIGRLQCNAQYFPGQIDDVRVYNYALTATQIKTLFNDGAVRFGPATGSP